MIDVNPNHLETVTRILAGHVPECEVRAFGSRVTWTAKDYSDLDLAVVGARALDPDALRRLKEAFEESDLPFRVDVLDWHAISSAFQKVIEKKCEVVQKGKQKSLGMAGEWRDCLIGDIADVIGGSTPSTKDPSNFDGDVPWLTPKDLSGPHDRYVTRGERNLTRQGLSSCSAQLVPAGTVLLSSRAPIGYIAIAKNPIATNQGFRNLLLRPGSVPGFMYYWLTANVPELERHSSGSTFKELSGGALKQIQIRIPPESEQRAIAHILGTLDDKIELNRRMNETLEAMARALFKSWFVDFDPVRAKAEGRDPGLPKPLADLFPDSFEDSDLGEIPKGWEVGGLDEIARFLNGLALQKYPATDGRALPVIKIAQLRAGTSEGADAASADLDPEYIVDDGDVLFSWSGSLECVLWSGGRGALNQHLFKVTSTEYPKWLCYLGIHQHLAGFRHIAAGKATTMGHIQRHHLSDARLAIPSSPLLKVIDSTMAPLIEALWRRRVESRTLAALRDTLLPKLISGEIRVKDVERPIEELPS